MRRKLDPRVNSNRGVNFTGRIKGMHVFIGNFTYIIDFMIVEDISSIINPRLSQVVLGRPFVEISNMTIEPLEGVVRLTNGTNKVAYRMPYKIEQYNLLSDLEKEHTMSVYLINEEDKRREAKFDEYPSVMMVFLRNIEGIGRHIRSFFARVIILSNYLNKHDFFIVALEEDELPLSELDFRARLDSGRMYSGHLKAKRLPWPA
uniref:Retrotransposon Orf1 n=1 Tax=Tanacetum cinerariifolium TaxID=118510 RepID=A0A6L2N3E4_TANCI|nr:retrotransposon Orf1 [Tanacetum cinerariifolium]